MTTALIFGPLFIVKIVMVVIGGALAWGGWRDWTPLYAIGPGKKLQKRFGHNAARVVLIAAGAVIAFLGFMWIF